MAQYKPRARLGPNYLQEGDRWFRVTDRIKFVPFSEIKLPRPWQPGRTEAIRAWGTPEEIAERLVSVPVEGTCDSNIGVADLLLPRFSRRGSEKYEIHDGIHRANVAKELGLAGILAYVSDTEILTPREAEDLGLEDITSSTTPPLIHVEAKSRGKDFKYYAEQYARERKEQK